MRVLFTKKDFIRYYRYNTIKSKRHCKLYVMYYVSLIFATSEFNNISTGPIDKITFLIDIFKQHYLRSYHKLNMWFSRTTFVKLKNFRIATKIQYYMILFLIWIEPYEVGLFSSLAKAFSSRHNGSRMEGRPEACTASVKYDTIRYHTIPYDIIRYYITKKISYDNIPRVAFRPLPLRILPP